MARVLVIDDEEEALLAVRRRLEREGYKVDTAATDAEGIQLILDSESPFDAIITDMSMDSPESGLQVLHAAFTRDMFAEVIVMTAYGRVSDAVECMRRGAYDYVDKNAPGVDVFELISEKIAGALARRRRDLRTIDLWERSTKGENSPGSSSTG